MRKQQQKFEVAKLTDEEIKEFERELEDYKGTTLFDNSLEYYGCPLKNQKDFSGYVLNPVLDGVHWSVVKYCLDKGIIKRYKDGRFTWLIALEDSKDFTRILDCPYKEFMPKWKGLQDLKQRRLYAKDCENEGLGFPFRERINRILDNFKLPEEEIKADELGF